MNRITNTLAGLSLAVLFFVATAHAQFGEPGMVASIPFEFTVGTLFLPAGQYEFQHSESGYVAVRDANGHTLLTLASASVRDNRTPGKSTLRFVTLQGRHVLAQVWNYQSATGYEFLYTPASVELKSSSDSPKQ